MDLPDSVEVASPELGKGNPERGDGRHPADIGESQQCIETWFGSFRVSWVVSDLLWSK